MPRRPRSPEATESQAVAANTATGFKAPETIVLQKILGLINTVRDNKNLKDQKEILEILETVRRKITTSARNYSQSSELLKLNRLLENYVRIVSENKTFFEYFENLLSDNSTNDTNDIAIESTGIEQLIAAHCKQNPELTLEESIHAMGYKINILLNNFKSATNCAERFERCFQDYFGRGFDDNAFIGFSRIIFIRNTLQEAISAIYQIQNKSEVPHHSFGLKDIFETMKTEFGIPCNIFKQTQDEDMHLVNKALPVIAPQFLQQASADAPASPVTSIHSHGGFFSATGSNEEDESDILTDSTFSSSDEEDEEIEETTETASHTSQPRSPG